MAGDHLFPRRWPQILTLLTEQRRAHYAERRYTIETVL